MADVVSNRFLTDLAKGVHNFTDAGGQTWKIALFKDTLTPTPEFDFMDDLVSASNECDGTGYQAGFAGTGRKTLGTKTVTQDDTNDWAKLDAADPAAWTGFDAGTVAWWVIYRHRTSDADSEFAMAIDVADRTPAGADYTAQFSSDGIAVIVRV